MNTNDELRMEWDPFSDNQVEGLFFSGAGRAELVEQLLHSLRYGPTLSLLVGPSGVGKRNLLVHLLGQMDPELFDVAVVEADSTLEFPQLLSKLDDPWRSLRPFTPENYLEMVPAVASAADEESKTLVCILVGAQQLSASVLDNLQTMLAASAGLPVKCVMLVDVAELEAAPSVHALVEALPDTAVLYLDPLDQTQTQEYLRYRLHTAGLGQISFNPEQLQRIAQTSGGIIARINEAARELLLEALPAPKAAPQKRALPWMHIGALGVVVVVLLALFLGRPDVDQQAEPTTSTVVLDNPVQPLTESATDELPFAEVARTAAEAAGTTDVQGEVDGGDGSAAVPDPAANVSPPMTATAPANVSPSAVPVSPPASTVVPGQEEPARATASASPMEPAPAPVASTKLEPAKPAASAPKPVATAANQSRTSWLLNLPGEHYVLQLLGAQEEATVKRFLNQYPSLRKVSYYKTWRQAKPWYVVVQGDYPSYDAAKAAVAQLPEGLRKQKPWVRKVEAIKKEIPR